MKKGILVRQRDATDCGPACLASVAAYYGLHIPVSRIREYAGTGPQGTSLYGLMEASKRLNFQARGARALPESLQEIPLPAIFHLTSALGMQHFVVVYRVNRNRIRYMDPARGEMIRKPGTDFNSMWSGVVLLLMPGTQFRPANRETTTFRRFGELISPHRGMLLTAFAGALVYTLLGLATSIYIQKIFDFVIPGSNRKLMNRLGLIMLVILLFQMVAGYLKSLIALRTGRHIDARLILGYYRHLMKLPQQFFDRMQVGEIISRVNDAVRIRTFINDTAQFLLVHIMTIIVSTTAMFLYNRKLALLVMLVMPVYGILYMIGNRINERWQRKIMETGAGLESHLLESVRGIATVRRFAVQEYFNRRAEKKFMPLMRAVYKSGKNNLALNIGSEGSTRLMTILILWTGTYFVMKGELSPGALLSFYTLTGYFTTPVQAMIGANKSMQDALIAADRLFEILDLETEKSHSGNQQAAALPEPVQEFRNVRCGPENRTGGNGVSPEYDLPVHSSCSSSLPAPGGDLEFRDVYFRYGPGNKVFSGLDLIIPQHRITAIAGKSGSGKSTLLSLLQRLYPLNGGNIFIGGADIQSIDLCRLRSMIAAVPQQTDLFHGTIASNIALGEESPDMERVAELCGRLGLQELIEQLPGRYGAMVSEQGINFSGGQKQRIAIARALYRDPGILLLDEATSALDHGSEQKVLETLRWFYSRKKTIILIAHRLSTVKSCHQVILLKDGKQVTGNRWVVDS